MTQPNAPALVAVNNFNQICLILLVSIVWLTRDACALPAVGGVNTVTGIQRYGPRQAADMQQILLNELLNNVNEDALYNELKKYQRQQPNYLSKWPSLRDILLMADYGEEADSEDADAAFEEANMRFIQRLRQLAANAVDDAADARVDIRPYVPPTLPFKKKPQPAPAAFKDHGIKKNIQYMSPCHFKICNMGRKRNARFFDD